MHDDTEEINRILHQRRTGSSTAQPTERLSVDSPAKNSLETPLVEREASSSVTLEPSSKITDPSSQLLTPAIEQKRLNETPKEKVVEPPASTEAPVPVSSLKDHQNMSSPIPMIESAPARKISPALQDPDESPSLAPQIQSTSRASPPQANLAHTDAVPDPGNVALATQCATNISTMQRLAARKGVPITAIFVNFDTHANAISLTTNGTSLTIVPRKNLDELVKKLGKNNRQLSDLIPGEVLTFRPLSHNIVKANTQKITGKLKR